MKVFNIGFTGKTAEEFFALLTTNGVKKLIDTRLNNTSQLASFASAKHLPYLLNIHNIKYEYMPFLAPTKNIMDNYKTKKISWQEYEKEYNNLLKKRNVMDEIDVNNFNNSVILCSEKTDECCHRRLFCEILKKNYPEIQIKAL